MSIPLAVAEGIAGTWGAAPRIEVLLPAGARRRQLTIRTLILGMLLVLADRRPAYLTEVHQALTALTGPDQIRLGVTQDWRSGPHLLTCRQVERTCRLAADALGKPQPDGGPSDTLTRTCNDLLEASIPARHKQASTALAVDWTDVETFARPPRHGTTACADPEASWGHRTSNLPGPKGEMFFGYYLSAGTTMREERGPAVPELARRMTLSSCHLDPVRAFVPVLEQMPADGIPPGDILADSGCAHRDAAAWAIPLRAAGAQLIQDLHPSDRGPRGTHDGAVIANGSLYCPATPKPLLQLGPLPPGATREQATAHDAQAAELARHKLGRISADDADGYHRVMCPAVMGKIRCPLRPPSMTLTRDRPEILTPPAQPASLLHPADPHRPAPGRRQDPPETRLPIPGAPPLLRTAHRLRAHLLHHQGPRHHQHRPRLVPPDGRHPAHPMARLPAYRPQPAHPRRLGRPPVRHRPAGRRRAPPKTRKRRRRQTLATLAGLPP